MKCIRLNEVAGGRRGKPQVAQIDIKSIDDIDKIELSDDEVNDIQRKSDFEVYRSLGKLDELDLTKDIISALNDFNSNLKSVDDYQFVVKQKDTYFVLLGTDGITVIINTDIDNLNWSDFAELCQKIKISTLIGNVVLEHNYKITEFPEMFPQKVIGDVILFNLPKLRNIDNMPKDISGEIVYLPGSRHLKVDIRKKYPNKQIKFSINAKTNAIFNRGRSYKISESLQDIIKKRIYLSKLYMM